MNARKDVTIIRTADFEEFCSEVTTSLWNSLLARPDYYPLKPSLYADLYSMVQKALAGYRDGP